MNEARRKALTSIHAGLETLKEPLEAALEGEREYYDAMPEGLQGGEKGEQSQNSISAMEDAVSSIEDAIGKIEEAQGT